MWVKWAPKKPEKILEREFERQRPWGWDLPTAEGELRGGQKAYRMHLHTQNIEKRIKHYKRDKCFNSTTMR